MSKVKFQVGDVVELKSYGPDMTVGIIGTGDREGYVLCTYYNEDHGGIADHWISVGALVKVKSG